MWAHKPWQGRYLPDKLDRSEQLSAYSTWVNTVEGNTTFYGLPAADTVRRWARSTPEAFRFVFKLPRSITHERRLRHCGHELAEFLDVIEPLGQRAATVSVQLPASFGPAELEDLGRFLDGASTTRRWAVEVRHEAFFADGPAALALERLLAAHGAEWVGFDTTVLFAEPPRSAAEREGWDRKPRLPRRTTALTDEPVVRYVGRDDAEATIAGWAPWIPVVAEWLADGRRPTFFVHTPDNDGALGLARRFHEEVRAVVPALDPLPTPIEVHPQTLF